MEYELKLNLNLPLIPQFAGVPTTTTSLDLRFNKLYRISHVDLASGLAAIPNTVTSLSLGNNFLNHKNGDELAALFKAIPKNIRHLDLSSNGLNTYEQLFPALAAIQSNITSVDLSDNNLYLGPAAYRAFIFSAIPATVKTLNLSNNSLYRYSASELAGILAAIPTTVDTLNLSNNSLYRYNASELARILAAILITITTLNLQDNYLGRWNINNENELDIFIDALLQTGKNIIIEGPIQKRLRERQKLQYDKIRCTFFQTASPNNQEAHVIDIISSYLAAPIEYKNSNDVLFTSIAHSKTAQLDTFSITELETAYAVPGYAEKMTPLDYAIFLGNSDVADYLSKRGVTTVALYEIRTSFTR